MSRGRLSLAFTLVAAFALAGGTHAALAAGTVVLRPPTGGTYAFKAPEATPYVGAREIVHYVTTGPDAPPLNDDNGDGYPDYVEQVAEAADAALALLPGARLQGSPPGHGRTGHEARHLHRLTSAGDLRAHLR